MCCGPVAGKIFFFFFLGYQCIRKETSRVGLVILAKGGPVGDLSFYYYYYYYLLLIPIIVSVVEI